MEPSRTPLAVAVRLLQVAAEELAGDSEDAGPFDAPHFRSAARVFAHLHLERPGHVVQIGAVEERVGSPSISRSVTSCPAAFSASYSMTLWPCGTELSASPCMIRNGGASFPT